MWLLFIACAPPPEAPAELGELSRFLFREHGGDEADLGLGLGNLSALLDDIDLDGSRDDRTYSLPLLEEDDVAGVERPDDALTDCLGLALAARSVWSVDDHAGYQALASLADSSPSASVFDRTVVEGDADCFTARTCTLRTVNHVVRENALDAVTFELHKDLRWVEAEGLGPAILARAWIEEPAHGEEGAAGSNHVWQHFELDVFVPDGEQTRRYVAVWAEPDYAAISAETAGSFLLKSMDETIAHTDEWLAE